MIGIVEVLVLFLLDKVVLEICVSDEQGVLKVYLILLVVVLVNEFTITGNGDATGLGIGICYLAVPYLVGCILGNVVKSLGLYSLVFGCDNGISGSVMALALIRIEGLADRCP